MLGINIRRSTSLELVKDSFVFLWWTGWSASPFSLCHGKKWKKKRGFWRWCFMSRLGQQKRCRLAGLCGTFYKYCMYLSALTNGTPSRYPVLLMQPLPLSALLSDIWRRMYLCSPGGHYDDPFPAEPRGVCHCTYCTILSLRMHTY